MNKIKKILIVAFAFIMALGSLSIFTACANNSKGNKYQIVCTVYAEYDWTKEVIGNLSDKYDVTLLTDGGADLHSYEPSVQDIAKIASADLFIYVGGESDEWVESAIANRTNQNQKIINLIETLGDKVREEEEVEGMTEEQGHEHEHEHEEEIEYDEHVWLSLKNAQIFVNKIAQVLGEIDQSNKDLYLDNASTYNTLLSALDNEYAESITNSTILVADRFPFLYLAKDYNITYYAAFKGCSAETEASAATKIFLIEKLNDTTINIKVIFKIDGSDGILAQSIKNDSEAKNQTILILDSIQSTSISNQTSYLKIMAKNLIALKQALNH